MIFVSLILNIVVLLPVCASLIWHAGWTKEAYGDPTPARGIMLSIYLSILAISVALAIALITAPSDKLTSMAIALFVVQILYKLTTPVTVRSVRNPVVISNLLIAAVHIVTVNVLWSQ